MSGVPLAHAQGPAEGESRSLCASATDPCKLPLFVVLHSYWTVIGTRFLNVP